MINDFYIYVTSFSISWHRLLRRSFHRSVRCSAIASQFTQSEAKGHSLVRPVYLASGEASINIGTSQLPFRGWGQIRLT